MGDQVLAPGWTSYAYRLRYQTYDVTDLAREGGNDLEEDAIGLGKRRAVLQVITSNVRARAFYRSAGYSEAELRRGWPRDRLAYPSVLDPLCGDTRETTTLTTDVSAGHQG